MRRAWIHVAALIVLLSAIAALNHEQPLVRNGLVYARAAWNVIDAGYDPRPVVADSHRSYDKPIGFAWLAAPLVARLGAHDGLRLVSLVGTIAYALAACFLARALAPKREDGSGAWWVAWLATLGPLATYQAWSAHPDSWFAALFVVAVALTHRLATGDERAVPRRALLLLATLLAAFLLKNYALILLPSCALYLGLHFGWRRRAGQSVGRRLLWCGAALGLFGAFVAAARFGVNPLSRLEGEGGGADQYALASFGSIWWKTLAQLALALGLQFHFAGLAVLAALTGLAGSTISRRAWRERDLVLPWLCFGAIYVAGLLPFPTAFYNMRYFLPLFPLLAIAVVRGAETVPARARTIGLISFLALNATTTLLFNWAPLFDAVRPHLPDTKVNWLEGGPPLSLLDNLRMEQHRDQAEWLRTIDQNAEPGATVYMVDVVYYRDAQQQVFERDGFLRRDLAIHYVRRRELQPNESHFFVWSFLPTPPDLTPFGRVTDLGNRVFRVDPR